MVEEVLGGGESVWDQCQPLLSIFLMERSILLLDSSILWPIVYSSVLHTFATNYGSFHGSTFANYQKRRARAQTVARPRLSPVL